MTTERERESQRLGLAYNDLAGALAFALDVVLPLEDRPISWQRVFCDECACWTNHDGDQHREKERDA